MFWLTQLTYLAVFRTETNHCVRNPQPVLARGGRQRETTGPGYPTPAHTDCLSFGSNFKAASVW